MVDPRLRKMANVLVNYSLQIKKGDIFVIQGSDLAMPLIKEVYREALRVGAHPEVFLKPAGINEIFYKEANEEQLSYVSPLKLNMVKVIDAILSISGEYNTKELSGVNPKRMALSVKSNKKISDIFHKRADSGELRWCLCQYPTHSSAQESNMSLDEYTEFIFDACLLNEDDPIKAWENVKKHHEKIIDYLKDKDFIEIKSKDTHLKLRVGGRKWINCCGNINFPDGEVFTAPIEDSVEGYIRFSFPGIYMGKEIEDIRLTFKKGKVVKAEATRGEDLLHALLDTDEGARYIGEFAIGTNYGIKKFTRNMLFDEKIGGTIHLALGNAYGESGGKNKSVIHWDMLCDMKDGGEIYADGELFYKDGKFLK
ncbi:aminopeptidase [Caloranaerobacter ferrireducens]|uniref:aminopeptidase n=1 Tax=Caloranaerobacter ferrireducens TaxID=1323370 RepID=UPI00084CF18C|nr:aminopeptidase [Caloranaerobacter ferrireducens]